MKTFITSSRLASACVASILLSGCVSTAPINNAQTGSMIGAVLGGVAGNQFGNGDGKTAMTILGTVVGSYIGSQWGTQLDVRDQQNLSQSIYSGQPATWQNPNTGYQYNVNPGQVYRASVNNQSTVCRPVNIVGTIDGRNQNIQTQACQDSRGQWQLTR